jgi:hypothetical protein
MKAQLLRYFATALALGMAWPAIAADILRKGPLLPPPAPVYGRYDYLVEPVTWHGIGALSGALSGKIGIEMVCGWGRCTKALRTLS